MVVIKGKQKNIKKRIVPSDIPMSKKAVKKLKRPQDNQPIPTVAV